MKVFSVEAIQRGNRALLRLAKYVEREAPLRGYDQTVMRTEQYNCDSPGCLMGFEVLRRRQSSRTYVYPDWQNLFAINYQQNQRLMGSDGCNSAYTDWEQAVAYVRAFVKRRETGLKRRKTHAA